MPPQDDSTPHEFRMEDMIKLCEKQGHEEEPLSDFLEAETTKSVSSDSTEETELTSTTVSSTAPNSASMTVMGIYTRAPVPREKELPEDYGLSHVKKDQVMCRRKMKTPPKDLQDKDQDVEEAMFVPEQGLVGPMFFHADLEEHDESDDEDEEEDDDEDWEPRIYEERAILFQSVEHYEQLIEEPKLSKYFHSEDAKVETKKCQDKDADEANASLTKEEILSDVLENPRFGEQIIVQGIDAQQIAIGDIFEIEGGLSPLKVEITSPRLCCSWVDKRQGSPFGMAGVKRFCNKNGFGGFFARVLVAGELRDEMKFVRTAHPHPKWTLSFVAYALYAEGPKTYLMAGWAHWQRSKEELKELCEIKQFGIYEWQEEAQYILDNWDSYRPEEKEAREAAARATMMGRLRLAVFESKVVENLRQYYTSSAELVDSKLSHAVPQGYLLHVLVVLMACIMFSFVLSSSA